MSRKDSPPGCLPDNACEDLWDAGETCQGLCSRAPLVRRLSNVGSYTVHFPRKRLSGNQGANLNREPHAGVRLLYADPAVQPRLVLVVPAQRIRVGGQGVGKGIAHDPERGRVLGQTVTVTLLPCSDEGISGRVRLPLGFGVSPGSTRTPHSDAARLNRPTVHHGTGSMTARVAPTHITAIVNQRPHPGTASSPLTYRAPSIAKPTIGRASRNRFHFVIVTSTVYSFASRRAGP
jgi:hypothetical protein